MGSKPPTTSLPVVVARRNQAPTDDVVVVLPVRRRRLDVATAPTVPLQVKHLTTTQHVVASTRQVFCQLDGERDRPVLAPLAAHRDVHLADAARRQVSNGVRSRIDQELELGIACN